MPPLKLPYNVSGGCIVKCVTLHTLAYSVTENPYTAAQRFLQNNDLPLSYIDQVVQFIEKNTASVNIGGANTQFVDPYTGKCSMPLACVDKLTLGLQVLRDTKQHKPHLAVVLQSSWILSLVRTSSDHSRSRI